MAARPGDPFQYMSTFTLPFTALIRRAVPTVAAVELCGPYLSAPLAFSTVKTSKCEATAAIWASVKSVGRLKAWP